MGESDGSRFESDPTKWVFIIFLTNVFGAIVYLARPYVDAISDDSVQYFSAREIEEAELAAKNIGNAYQHVQLGDTP
jgi:hypothetical protein